MAVHEFDRTSLRDAGAGGKDVRAGSVGGADPRVRNNFLARRTVEAVFRDLLGLLAEARLPALLSARNQLRSKRSLIVVEKSKLYIDRGGKFTTITRFLIYGTAIRFLLNP
jgi:hypothetical protein